MTVLQQPRSPSGIPRDARPNASSRISEVELDLVDPGLQLLEESENTDSVRARLKSITAWQTVP